uniref:protein-serine/threonine phosphatase n=1 Tax=Triticum urartu TaxID=4572 RepID=A0A8R7UVI0_TRIUA
MTSAFLQVLATEPNPPVCLYTLLERAYEETVASAVDGGSTAVILSLAGTALKWAFIGDSAFAVFQDGRLEPFAAAAEAFQLPVPSQCDRQRGAREQSRRRANGGETRGRRGARDRQAVRQHVRRGAGGGRADGHVAGLVAQEHGGRRRGHRLRDVDEQNQRLAVQRRQPE